MTGVAAAFASLPGAGVPSTSTTNGNVGSDQSVVVTIPTGAVQMVVEAWGGGGSGGTGGVNSDGGPGSGGYTKKTIALTSSDWGKTLNVTAGGNTAAGAAATGHASTISSGTYVISTMTANGGVACPSGDNHGHLGGTALGGTTNTNGGAGADYRSPTGGNGGDCPNGGSGGAGGTNAGAPGADGGTPGGGAGGAGTGVVSGAGAIGRVKIAFT